MVSGRHPVVDLLLQLRGPASIAAVAPLLKTYLGLNNQEIGWLGASFGLAYGLCSPLAGYVVDRVRRKAAILGGLYIWSLICMATALCKSFAPLLVLRAAEGLGETFYYPASTSLISAYHGRDTRSRGLGIHQTSVYVGTIAGGFFAAYIGEQYGWRWSFVVFGGLGILLGLAVNKWVIEPAGPSDDGEKTTAVRMSMAAFLKTLVRSPTVLLLMSAFMCANYVAMVLLVWMPTFLYEKFHLSLSMAGLTATIYVQLTSMVGAPWEVGWPICYANARRRGGCWCRRSASSVGRPSFCSALKPIRRSGSSLP